MTNQGKLIVWWFFFGFDLQKCLNYQYVVHIYTSIFLCFCSLTSSLRIRILTETQPDTRLHRILHKKRFDEAKNFAEQFNLDVEVCSPVVTDSHSYKLDFFR